MAVLDIGGNFVCKDAADILEIGGVHFLWFSIFWVWFGSAGLEPTLGWWLGEFCQHSLRGFNCRNIPVVSFHKANIPVEICAVHINDLYKKTAYSVATFVCADWLNLSLVISFDDFGEFHFLIWFFVFSLRRGGFDLG